MAKLPITLEAGTADKKLAYTDNLYDKEKEKFQSEINSQLSSDVYDLNQYQTEYDSRITANETDIATIKANNWVTTNRINNKAVTEDKLSQTLQDKLTALSNAASGGMHFVGVTSTALTDGATTATLTPLTTNSMIRTTGFLTGDIVVYDKKEFIWGSDKWIEFGDMSGLGTLASKNSASGTINGIPTSTHTHSVGEYTHTVTQGSVSANGSYVPKGSVTLTTGDLKITKDEGIVRLVTSSDTEDVSIKGVAGTTTVKSVTNVGSLPTSESKTIPNITSVGTMFSASVTGETLVLTEGSAPTLGTAITVNSMKTTGSLPTTSNVTVATADNNATTFKAVDVKYDLDSQLVTERISAIFNGTQETISVSGTTSGVSVANHAQKNTGNPSATENKTVTVS